MSDQPQGQAVRRASGDTRDRLLQAARAAFGSHGYVATRVDDIVRRAGTSHGTFYTYFKDKKDVLVGLTTEIAHSLYGAALSPAVEPDRLPTPRELVRARIASFLETYRRHWGVIRSWTQAEGVHPDVEQAKSRIRRAIVTAVAELLHRDKERGLIKAELRTDFLATALVAMTEGFANDRFTSGVDITDRDLDDLTDLWVRAVYRSDLAT
ncbi:MAG: TetR/AcrR family transcriptional regulator [Candidatus Binatia bacterium]